MTNIALIDDHKIFCDSLASLINDLMYKGLAKMPMSQLYLPNGKNHYCNLSLGKSTADEQKIRQISKS